MNNLPTGRQSQQDAVSSSANIENNYAWLIALVKIMLDNNDDDDVDDDDDK